MLFLFAFFAGLVPTPPNVRFAEHRGYTIRHTRSTGLTEILNARGRILSSWTCASFQRAVRQAQGRLTGETVLRNPWVRGTQQREDERDPRSR